MLIGVPRESWPGELRAALVPTQAKKLVEMGFEVRIETGLGTHAGYLDDAYREAGASVESDHDALLAGADVILHVRPPAAEDVAKLRPGAVHVSFLDPFKDSDLIEQLAARGVTAVSLEMVPRSTRAQKMDALSSQASLAGYVTVILASYHLRRIFPMMMTPAGTIAPTRVFVIGAGVAGLQAIATAKRLGARVEAFDTRPVVAEQIESLGAKFVNIDIGEIGQTEQGYARELTAEQIAKQREGMKNVIAQSDVVITTAQVFGRPAPKIVMRDMVAAMKPGSVIVDMAVESGGNVEGSVAGEIVETGNVKIIGLDNLPSQAAQNASDMFASNLVALLDEFWDAESATLDLDPEDEIVKACVLTRDSAIVNAAVRS